MMLLLYHIILFLTTTLDLMRAPGEWTIRQTVHHLAESASLFLLAIKSALAQSGSPYVRNPYDQEHWVEALDYRGRPIEPSLMLIQAVHRHISQLLSHLPDPWDHYIMMKFADEEGGREDHSRRTDRNVSQAYNGSW